MTYENFLQQVNLAEQLTWRIHGGSMADSWRMGLQKLITVLDMRNGYKGGV
jgi:hypothetical protein